MLYLLIICIIVCAAVCWQKADELSCITENKDYIKKLHRHMYLAIIMLIFFIISSIVGTVFVCNSNFLSITTEGSSNTYQVTDFSASKSKNNLLFDGDYETIYSITIEDNFLIEISSQDFGTEVICDTYNPTTITIDEEHYFKWWFMCSYDTYTYKLS